MKTLLAVSLNWRRSAMIVHSAKAALREMQSIPVALAIVGNDSGNGSFETLTSEIAARGWDQPETPVRVIPSGRKCSFGADHNLSIRAGLSDGARLCGACHILAYIRIYAAADGVTDPAQRPRRPAEAPTGYDRPCRVMPV